MSVLDGPGEGTWSVFALKAVEERDEARERLQDALKRIEQLKAAIGDQSKLILEAEERGAMWAIERHGYPFTSLTREEYVKEICDSARRVGILKAVAEQLRKSLDSVTSLK
jgi:hypothetical protein